MNTLKPLTRLFLAAITAGVLTLVASAPAHAAGPRMLWQYDGGQFQNYEMGHWRENNSSGTYYFSEVVRTVDYVELLDTSRGYTVRLDATSMVLIGGRAGVVPVYTTWTFFYNGHWVN